MEYTEAKIIHSQNIYEKFNEDSTYLYLNQFMKNGNRNLQKSFLEFLNFQPIGRRIDEKFDRVVFPCLRIIEIPLDGCNG